MATGQYTRIYRPRGTVAHLREDVAPGELILCRKATPWAGGYDETWLGTGSQAEYDRAAALPLCRDCHAASEPARRVSTNVGPRAPLPCGHAPTGAAPAAPGVPGDGAAP